MMSISAVPLGLSLFLIGAAYAAGPFDGKWVGETPSVEGCGIWKFNFTVTDNNVSGYVEGALRNNSNARGYVLSGTVSPDGSAQVVWGANNHFQGGFRFTQNSWTGNVSTACGQTTMSGARASS